LESSQYHEKGYKLIGAIIDIAKKLDYIVIAEGVETKEQLEILKQLNCYGGQGYLMCPPVPVRELIPFIEANNS
jgi:EAL domain-containing protein (putative c-di-GMP-specific phosphodiesterase class I)